MLEVFQNMDLERIVLIYWPNKISNKELHKRTGMQHISLEVKHCRWRWTDHICRMPLTTIPRVVTCWTLGEKRAWRRPKATISGAGDENIRIELGTSHKFDRKHLPSLVAA